MTSGTWTISFLSHSGPSPADRITCTIVNSADFNPATTYNFSFTGVEGLVDHLSVTTGSLPATDSVIADVHLTNTGTAYTFESGTHDLLKVSRSGNVPETDTWVWRLSFTPALSPTSMGLLILKRFLR